MPSNKDRYEAATSYVRRAIGVVERVSFTDIVERVAAPRKTEHARNELARIEARWLRAASDDERTRIARDAELLADRVQESLPGAPQDRARTNLARDEYPSATPPTSFADVLGAEVDRAWQRAKGAAHSTSDSVQSLGRWLLVGGALVVGWRAFGFLEQRERRIGSALNSELARVANRERS